MVTKTTILHVGLVSLVTTGCHVHEKKSGDTGNNDRMNVILISVDDLRTGLERFYADGIKTPNFYRLAADGITFSAAYCQAAVSAPSRASLMTGLRPDSLKVWHLGDEFRKINPDVVTMPQYFKRYGYHTVSIGKIFHNHMPDSVSFDEPDLRPEAFKTPDLVKRDAESFYVDKKLMDTLALVRAERIKVRKYGASGGWGYGAVVEKTEAHDTLFYDGALTELALRKLRELKRGKQPFYLALGYFRPHLPFSAPAKYWNLYDRNQILIPANNYLPEGCPPMAPDSNYELNGCYDMHVKHPAYNNMSADTARLLIHGYLACVSFIDACLGKLLDELERLNLSENTIIALYGDNGWKLGEHNAWCKQTNYEPDIHVPLIISAPGMKNKGVKSNALVELIDIFPTLCEATGIPVAGYLQGTSMVPLIDNPGLTWKSAVFSQIHRLPRVSPDGKRYMGFSMRTENWHYIKWYFWNDETKSRGEWVASELYDMVNDGEENRNLVSLPEYSEIISQLDTRFQQGWRKAIPDTHQ